MQILTKHNWTFNILISIVLTMTISQQQKRWKSRHCPSLFPEWRGKYWDLSSCRLTRAGRFRQGVQLKPSGPWKSEIFLSPLRNRKADFPFTFRTLKAILQCYSAIATYIVEESNDDCCCDEYLLIKYFNIWMTQWVKCVTRKIFELQTWEAARSGSSKPSTSFPPSHSKSWNKFSFEILK